MIRIGIVVGSTRSVRRTEVAARWVAEVANRHPAVVAGDATFEVVDLAEHGLPLLDEDLPALFGAYRNTHTKRWAAVVGSFDGFVFVTPEYNHSMPAALKNAIDYLFAEWNDKAAGFVSHGVHGGVRAVEHLRLALAEVKVATVRSQVALSAFTDFVITDPVQPGECSPGEHQESTLNEMLDELVAWSRALKAVRESSLQSA
ncbi:NAD(P)H-dependent oxidoreductase [Saccharopolyspora sp. WRP15-2]|uniref:NAD(P)H-dependent oxidoreductase n=1 Tax=Saccharopolyspora oryzae TaxID=2997343 RepID=A0ABT4UYD9_9PSEU|nr:NAD(P)H-dependent oxidoreductase [Saccharopolyspora oryzae]MDA3626102.1 NAD(P)H-dependent oxidoreductase [Saccharopolyspora oryzae]